MAGLSRLLRKMERDGNFDPQASSSAARPGLRRFLDYSAGGFKRDGNRQLPPER
jgi:hypothetical protein